MNLKSRCGFGLRCSDRLGLAWLPRGASRRVYGYPLTKQTGKLNYWTNEICKTTREERAKQAEKQVSNEWTPHLHLPYSIHFFCSALIVNRNSFGFVDLPGMCQGNWVISCGRKRISSAKNPFRLGLRQQRIPYPPTGEPLIHANWPRVKLDWWPDFYTCIGWIRTRTCR